MTTYVNYNFKETLANIQSWEEKEQRKQSICQTKEKKALTQKQRKRNHKWWKKEKHQLWKQILINQSSLLKDQDSQIGLRNKIQLYLDLKYTYKLKVWDG